MRVYGADETRSYVVQAYFRGVTGNRAHIFSVPGTQGITEYLLTGEPNLAPFVSADDLVRGVADKLEQDAPLPEEISKQMAIFNIPFFLQDDEVIVPIRARSPHYLLIGGSVLPISVVELTMNVWHFAGMLLYHWVNKHSANTISQYRAARGITVENHDDVIKNNRSNRRMKRYETVSFLFGHDFRFFFAPPEGGVGDNFMGRVYDSVGMRDGSIYRVSKEPSEQVKEILLQCQNLVDIEK